jgi:hypothetical protein
VTPPKKETAELINIVTKSDKKQTLCLLQEIFKNSKFAGSQGTH